jgi:4,5-dihydroxyphthalate decarboxylase
LAGLQGDRCSGLSDEVIDALLQVDIRVANGGRSYARRKLLKMALKLTVTCGDFDRTRRLMDGRVQIEGVDVEIVAGASEAMFSRAFADAPYDVSELSFSNFMYHTRKGSCAYVGLPVFPSRAFRHSTIYVRTDRVHGPADLKGKRVGVREYSNTASLVARGMLQDDHGVLATDISWVVGDIDRPERPTITVPSLPSGFDVQPAAGHRLLSDMLVSGDLDAIVAYDPPRCFLEGVPGVARLFTDHVAAERSYFAKTGIFPIMHLMGLRGSIAEREPWVAESLYRAFNEAKNLALADLAMTSILPVSLPWCREEFVGTRELMGPDFWPYGIAHNRATIESLTRYSHAQGITNPRLTIEELFHPATHNT